MIGIFDYTVILTYLSLASAASGILISLSGDGHPYIGVFFLLFCGLCDAFDGKVARSKKNRTERDKNFGIQIDSLSDLVAFGVLPGCIGSAMLRRSVLFNETLADKLTLVTVLKVVMTVILVLFALAAMIRLAYFNVTEAERQRTSTAAAPTHYTGLPVTSSALIFPTIMLIQYLVPADITPIYFAVMLLTSFCFLAKFNLKKPNMKWILIMVGIGVVEFIAMFVLRCVFNIQ